MILIQNIKQELLENGYAIIPNIVNEETHESFISDVKQYIHNIPRNND